MCSALRFIKGGWSNSCVALGCEGLMALQFTYFHLVVVINYTTNNVVALVFVFVFMVVVVVMAITSKHTFWLGWWKKASYSCNS